MINTIKTMDKSLYILFLGVLLTHLGSFLVIPILPIMLRESVGLSLSTIGGVLASYAIAFQFGSILGGFLADRLGRRTVISGGAFIAAIGFVSIGLFDTYLPVLFSVATAGLGNGLNAPSTKAAIASIASKENQTTAFSFRGIAANIGTGTAGLIVFFLITGSPKIVYWIAGITYLVITVLSWIFVPKGCGEEECKPVPLGAYKEVFSNKPFVIFGLVSILIWVLYAQLALALPIRATDVLENPGHVALIWTIKSVTVILLQTIITKHIISRVHPLFALFIGILLIGGGVGFLYFANSFIGLAISGTIFVLGEMLLLPTMDSTISQLSKANLIGIFFGLANVVSGLGEATGHFLGGRLLDLGTNSYIPWITYAIASLLIGGMVLLLIRWKPMQDSLISAAKQKDKPKEAPRVNPGPPNHQSLPLNRWEEEIFFRRKSPT
ncbi:MFS transporter [Bacillaceae bacterium S4-13-56]